MHSDSLHAMTLCTGIGLRHPHLQDILSQRPRLGFLEVHSENYFGAGGPPHFFLNQIAQDYPLSLHGVGLSLGSTDPLSRAHLWQLKRLIQEYRPALVSEHLSWSSVDGRYANDLLPMPFTEEAVVHLAARIGQVQHELGQQILVENVSQYVRIEQSSMTEWEFVSAVVEMADCGLLLDVNNVYVNANNMGFDAKEFLDSVPADRVREIHLAGFDEGPHCLIDTHAKPVHADVWALYQAALLRFGPRPTLIEWDKDLPALSVLLDEAGKANVLLEQCHVAA